VTAISSRRERLRNRRRSQTFELECVALRSSATIGRFRDGLTRDRGNLAEISLWRLNDVRRMPELAAVLVRAHQRACELRLVDRRGAER
jgi:hypothetical protein